MPDEMPDDTPGDVDANGGRGILALVLIAGGVLLILFAPGLGIVLVQHNSSGNVSWSQDEANAMAVTLRYLGGMAFIGGCVERIIIAIIGTSLRK